MSVLISITLFSCEKNSVEINSNESAQTQKDLKTIVFDGLTAKVSKDFPDDVAALTSSDLKQIAENSKNLRSSSSGKSFWEIFDGVKKKYPDVTNFEPKEYLIYFPEMTVDEIVERQEKVLSFIEGLIGYETAVEFSRNGSYESISKNGRSSATNYDGYDPNSCEIWYFAGHARLDRSGIEDAMNLAYQYGGYGNNDASDARRHGILAVMVGKYGARRYATVSKARDVAEGFLEAHECNDSGMSKAMDLHNNKVGFNYFETIAERYKEGLFNYSVRVNTSDNDISTYVHGMSIVVKTTEPEINAVNGSTLVRFQ